MYDTLEPGDYLDRYGPEGVLRHRGDLDAFLEWHLEDARRAVAEGLKGIREHAPRLLERIADARTLRHAWDHLATKGGGAPGPNGHRYCDYTSSEAWDLCRCLAAAIGSETYRPGPSRTTRVDKASGTGQRPIVLLNIEDRVVQRAIVIVLRPFLDPLLEGYFFGSRPKVGRWHALAAAERLTIAEEKSVWVVDDIKDAYQHVPLPPLLDIVHKFFPDRPLVQLIERVVSRPTVSGLQQGGPLSPLMLALYLRHVLVRRWKGAAPTSPLLIYVDDILVPCASRRDGHDAHERIRAFLEPAGMKLKSTAEVACKDLAAGAVATWLGIDACIREGQIRYSIGERSWRRLEDQLSTAHAKPDSSLRVYRFVRRWLADRAPCYREEQFCSIYERIKQTCRQHGFEEIPSADVVGFFFRERHDQWNALRSDRSSSEGPPGSGQTHAGHRSVQTIIDRR